jgi:SAM-dependent methyltransferase
VAADVASAAGGVVSFYSDFADYYEQVFPFREEAYAFLRRCLLSPSGRILDAGCGTGHYCGRLAADGFQVVGIDLDPKMIEVAQARYPKAAFRRLDMREVGRLPGPFAGAFCIGNTVSHLSRDELGAFLRDLSPRLLPGAPWIVQPMNWDYILERGGYVFQPRRVGDAVSFERAYTDLSEDRVRFATRLLVQGAPVFEGDVWLHPIRTADYRQLHADAGLDLIEQRGDFQGRAFDAHADTGNVLVFRKRGGVGAAA